MNGGALVTQSLKRHGVEFIFGLPDTTILSILDAVRGEQSIRYMSVRHESVASMMADGYARAAGRPGVCISQCGAGAMNMLYGVASAFKDSTPMIAITGNIESRFVGRDTWHDIDLTALYAPVTKWSTRVTDVRDISTTIDQAFRLASSGRPGPVHISIPMDLQAMEIPATEFEPAPADLETRLPAPSQADIDRAVRALAEAERPVIFAGGGVIWANATDVLTKFTERTSIPVIVSDNGRGAIPENHPHALGASGFFGSPIASKILREADAIFGVGTRFPDTCTGKWQDISRSAIVIQNNTDCSEIGRRVPVSIGIVADAKQCLEAMLDRWQSLVPGQGRDRASRVAVLKKAVEAEFESALATPPGVHDRIPIQDMVREMADTLGEDVLVAMDGGLFQICSARLPVYRPRSYFSSAGLGAMGYALPAAMGAKLAQPDRPVVAIAGDGGFQMVSPDIETAVRCQIPVVIVIYNNDSFAAPRAHQKRTFGGRLIGVNHTNPDFAELAKLYGAEGRTVRKIGELRPALEALLRSGKVGVIDVHGE